MLTLEEENGGKVLVSPRYFVSAWQMTDKLTEVRTTSGTYIVTDTVEDIIDVIVKSTQQVLVG